MIAAFFALSSLIILLPTLMMADGILASGVASTIAAIAIFAAAFTLHLSDLNRFSRLLRPAAFIVLLVPCLWMLLQVLPISYHSLANPIWTSASVALDKRFAGAISPDIGATLLSLVRYCAVLAASVVAALIALSRQRADNILSLLTGIAALIAAALIGYELEHPFLSGYENLSARADAVNVAIIGLILSSAKIIRAYAHVDGLRDRKSRMLAALGASASIAVLFICLYAILIYGDPVLLLAGLFGVGSPVCVLVIRRWRLGPLGQAGIAAIGALAVFGLFAIAPAKKDADSTLALSTRDQTSSIERMLSDTRWTGSGAGSFDALLPIYRATDEMDSVEAPTAAATLAIEMGRPFLWTGIAIGLLGAATLFRRAGLRRRDYIYASAGAGCILAFLITLFANDGALGLGTSMMTGMVCGLAFAQSKSTYDRQIEPRDEPYRPPGGMNLRQVGTVQTNPERAGKRRRLALVLLGVFLSAQAVWILLAEEYRADHMRLPLERQAAAIAFAERDRIRRASSLAAVRGDLWADSAFTYGGELWIDRGMARDRVDQLGTEALTALNQALRFSPHRGDVWLMFAALADRYNWPQYQPSLLLKMSYYTAPNELALLPLRLTISLHIRGVTEDAELQDMVKRDIRVVLTRAPALRPALVAAYRSGSPLHKAFADRVISEIDPGYLGAVRTE